MVSKQSLFYELFHNYCPSKTNLWVIFYYRILFIKINLV